MIALFDDVFSGLDGQTAHTVFENLFGERGLLRQWNTTTVLATQSGIKLQVLIKHAC